MKYLIINADDFGLCTETNEAIEKIFNEGTITSTTIMAPNPGFSHGIKIAKENKNINLGMHITLNSEWKIKCKSISSKDEVSSILNEDGYFYETVVEFAKHAKGDEVIKEIEAQYKKIAENNLKITHADSHMGAVYGLTGTSFMKETLEFCAKYKLPFRFPKNLESVSSIIKMQDLPEELKAMHKEIINYANFLKVPLIDTLLTNTLPFSEIKSYDVLRDSYLNLILNLKDGVTEIFLHPSKDCPNLSFDNPKWIKREWEFQFLLSSDIKKLIDREKIELIGWKDLSLL